jgi:hypothetical protein
MLGPLWATDIHTPGLTLRLQKTLSLFRPVLRFSGSPTSHRTCLRNYELNVNGLNHNAANSAPMREPAR